MSTSAPLPVAMDKIHANEPAEIAAFVASSAHQSRVTYLNIAKGVIALEAKVGRDAAKAFFKEVGVTDHTLKNARQAVQVWEDVVAPGYAEEGWFDQLVYMDCVAINAALRAGALASLVEQGAFKQRPSVAHGKFLKAAKDTTTVAAKAAPSEKPDTSDTPAKTSDDGVSHAKRVMAQLDAVEKSLLQIIDLTDQVTGERVRQRFDAVATAVHAALEKRWPRARVEELQSLGNRATA